MLLRSLSSHKDIKNTTLILKMYKDWGRNWGRKQWPYMVQAEARRLLVATPLYVKFHNVMKLHVLWINFITSHNQSSETEKTNRLNERTKELILNTLPSALF